MNTVNATSVFSGLFKLGKGSAGQVPRKTLNIHDPKQRKTINLILQRHSEQTPVMQAAPQFEPEENAEIVNALSPLNDCDDESYHHIARDGLVKCLVSWVATHVSRDCE